MKSDFEKLVIARRYIEMLQKENELLKKEVESEHQLTLDARKALKDEQGRKEKMTPDEKLKIKGDLYVQQMRDTINNLRTKLKTATDDNKKLIEQVIRLKSGNKF
ncbi:MAG: hypothetical protein HEP71_14205 [Roseivirga sp.]|nr:hypothetical protein [Roseivirga sp.]